MPNKEARRVPSNSPGSADVDVYVGPEGLAVGHDTPTEPLHVETTQANALLKSTTAGSSSNVILDSDNASAGNSVAQYQFKWNGNLIAFIRGVSGDDTSNKDEGDLAFATYAGGSPTIVMRVTQEGSLMFDNLATQTLEIIDAGTTGATEQAWVEVKVNGTQGYLRVFATK